ncbi:hypothetical protein GQ43DRAFT_152637 [Delitschia confertaspora ATCC 74209]|uniref:Uncharacterized protein n=1 Tax=Delitschia confertaspora ATCC 74209 TaxID=1513339 RepID=A0A9P4MVC4_9PLEO|nr:hypothetical protein GQ43DRAFT_152637 [Delitschia confertaspora ATCC 74209]
MPIKNSTLSLSILSSISYMVSLSGFYIQCVSRELHPTRRPLEIEGPILTQYTFADVTECTQHTYTRQLYTTLFYIVLSYSLMSPSELQSEKPVGDIIYRDIGSYLESSNPMTPW